MLCNGMKCSKSHTHKSSSKRKCTFFGVIKFDGNFPNTRTHLHILAADSHTQRDFLAKVRQKVLNMA